jgi:hypothetical protein
MSLIKKLNQIIAAVLPNKNKQAQPFEKVMFKDRLIRYDEQIEMEYLSLKDAEWFQFEPLPNDDPFTASPLQLKIENRDATNLKLKQLKLLRKKANLSSKELIEGIELLLKYGVWTDQIVSFLDVCMNNEDIYTSDAHMIITTLLENSIRAVPNEDEEDFESYIAFDFEKYFEEHLSIKLKVAGFLDIKFSQTVSPFYVDEPESLLVYRFVIEYGNQKRFIRIESDCDIFLLLRSISNGILMESGSNMRFYRMQFCPYPILLEKELALDLMKKHNILIFHENWSFPTSFPEYID